MNSVIKTVLLIILIYCYQPISSIAQVHTIKSTPFLNHLLKSKKAVTTINNINNNDLFDITILGHIFPMKELIKTDSGLYLLFTGTGRVYKAKEAANDSISFTRIDSTLVFGFNYNAINFAHKNILYSFGGYGIWHINGQLRYFNFPMHEWFIEKLDQKFNTINSIYHDATDSSHKNPAIFYITTPTKNEEGFEKEETEFNVIKYDIATKANRKIGRLNKLLEPRPIKGLDLPSLHGIVMNTLKEHYLLNFEENKAYKLTNKLLIGLEENTNLYNTFEEDGKLYYSIYPDTNLYSTPVSMADFSAQYITIYEDENFIFTYWWLFIIIFIVTALVIYKKVTGWKSKTKNIDKVAGNESYDKKSNEFTEIEKTIIFKIIEKSNSEIHFSVDEMNQYLGIKRKSLEIQKKIRTESINRINHKFNVVYDKETTFIERVRSKEDRRFFNYMINQENINSFLQKQH